MRFQCGYCKTILAVDTCEPGEAVACGQCGNAIAVPESRIATGAVVGDFVIQKELGRGGMGCVYLSHQISLDRPAAVKVLHSRFSADENYISDFVREARAAAGINHSNIVQAYAVGNDDGLYFFAMEYVEGSTLKQVLLHGGRMVPERALQVANDVAMALEFGWTSQRLVHRDIKPDNIILTASGKTMLADLGLARQIRMDDPELSAEELHGTPQYISPEQLLGEPGNNQSDVYSLGGTLYHALTGQYPYSGGSPLEIAQKHLTDPLVSPSAIVPAVPAPVCRLVQIMMAKRPEHRYADTAELIQDLARVRADQMPLRVLPKGAQAPIIADGYEPVAVPAVVLASVAAPAVVVDAAEDPVAKPVSVVAAAVVPEAVVQAVLEIDVDEGVAVATVGDLPAPGLPPEEGDDDLIEAGEESSKSKLVPIMVAIIALIAVVSAVAFFMFYRGASTEGAVAEGHGQNPAEQRLLTDLRALISAGASADKVVGRLVSAAPELGADEEFLELAAPYVEKDLVARRQSIRDAELEAWQAEAIRLAEAARLAKEKADEQAKAEEERRRKAAENQQKHAAAAAEKAEVEAEKDALRWQSVELCQAHKYQDAGNLFVPMMASRNDELKQWAAAKQHCITLAEELFKSICNSEKKMAGVKLSLQGKDWIVTQIGYRHIDIERRVKRYEDGVPHEEVLRERIPFTDMTPPTVLRLSSSRQEKEGLSEADQKAQFGAYLLARAEFLAQAKLQLQASGKDDMETMLVELETMAPVVQEKDFARLFEELKVYIEEIVSQ